MDEWILDGLTRGTPLAAWQNLTQMIGLLQDLSSFLKNTDPALSTYHSLSAELAAAEDPSYDCGSHPNYPNPKTD